MDSQSDLFICLIVFGFVTVIIFIKVGLSVSEHNTHRRSALRRRRIQAVFPESIIPKINPIIQIEETHIQYREKEESIQPEYIV
jgi:hypothetical protein